MSRIALAASIINGLIAAGHTVKGFEIFASPTWKSLPKLLFAYARVGWYQGSVFFAIAGLYTYQLSQRSPATWTGIDRIIVGMTSLLYLGSSAWYYKNGDGATGTLVAVAGAVQGSILTS
ncbi:hypothetical protein PV10_02006 [Exophiala mesophila]|uniref:Uncharacterized protein n=1 Tax=Exophiala mesophila TaxID=212818 RepID=A0A0D2A5C1_EXOME|nr:uncharacterized protein PV10_02006 [Exophiala mesophila]KIV94218.1 hypothetical protein PV10_02006 [Exophiala mesophila]